MRRASNHVPDSAEKTVRDIRRVTRRHHSAEGRPRPAVRAVFALTAAPLTVGAPALGAQAYNQHVTLSAASFVDTAPVMPAPTLGTGGSVYLSAASLTVTAPVIPVGYFASPASEYAVVSANLSGSTLDMPASSAGAVAGAVTVTTTPAGGPPPNTPVIIGSPYASQFALTNGGWLPCNVVVGSSNIPLAPTRSLSASS